MVISLYTCVFATNDLGLQRKLTRCLTEGFTGDLFRDTVNLE